jgi:hypothetical protein
LLALVTSFYSSKLALCILHNRWHEFIQSIKHHISSNHRHVLIYINLAFNVFIGIYLQRIMGGMCVISGALRVKNKSLNAEFNSVFPLVILFGAHHVFHLAG